MKKSFLMMIVFASVSVLSPALSHADDDLAPLGLSKACELDIVNHVKATCNRQSRGDGAREHPCLEDEVTILRNAQNAAYFTVLLTVTDADDYNYGVSVTNKARCAFGVYPQQK